MSRIELVNALHALAAQFNTAARSTVPVGEQAMLTYAAASLRLTAGLVFNGTYDLITGRAWLDAGRITIKQRGAHE